ncbi:hypothetical protein SARC_15818, partial [Sphaeroforma arctica JP610]
QNITTNASRQPSPRIKNRWQPIRRRLESQPHPSPKTRRKVLRNKTPCHRSGRKRQRCRHKGCTGSSSVYFACGKYGGCWSLAQLSSAGNKCRLSVCA